jgi:hypothetical protein
MLLELDKRLHMGTGPNNRPLLPPLHGKTIPPLTSPPPPHVVVPKEAAPVAEVAMMTPLRTEVREVVGTVTGGGETIAVTIGGVVTTVTVANATTDTTAAAPPLPWH